MLYVIHTDKDNQLMSLHGLTIVFRDKRIVDWFLAGTCYDTGLPTFSNYKIEVYKKRINFRTCMTETEWLGGKEVIDKILKFQAIRENGGVEIIKKGGL